MKTLYVSVANKIATYQKRCGAIVCGNSDYQIKFAFDAEWAEHTKKTARFVWRGQYFDVEFTGDTCNVPVISGTTTVEVGVYAGDLETTTGAEIPCRRSILCKGGKPHPETGQHYTNEAVAAAKAAKASEENAAASEAAAKTSEENASASATASANSASQAQSSATEAAESATQAQECMEITQGIAADYENIDGRISRNSKRISNLEKGITPSPFETDATVARTKAIPATSLPYALLQKVGGMSYAGDFSGLRSAAVTKVRTIGKNLLNYSYSGTVTQKGVTFTRKADGGISVTGTPTDAASTSLCTDGILPQGIRNLHVSMFGEFSNLAVRVQLKNAAKKQIKLDDHTTNVSIDIEGKYPTAAFYSVWIARKKDGIQCSGTIYPMLSIEMPTEFEQYKELTHFDIPADVQALEGYGLGISADVNNHINWDDDGKAVFNRAVKSFVISSADVTGVSFTYDDIIYYKVPKPTDALDYYKYSNHYLTDAEFSTTDWGDASNIGKTSGYASEKHYWFGFEQGTTLAQAQAALAGKTIVYQLATTDVTDIPKLITLDNIIEVAGGGTLWFENQYNLAPASTVTYQTKEETV